MRQLSEAERQRRSDRMRETRAAMTPEQNAKRLASFRATVAAKKNQQEERSGGHEKSTTRAGGNAGSSSESRDVVNGRAVLPKREHPVEQPPVTASQGVDPTSSVPTPPLPTCPLLGALLGQVTAVLAKQVAPPAPMQAPALDTRSRIERQVLERAIALVETSAEDPVEWFGAYASFFRAAIVLQRTNTKKAA
jgi:hypothetical protein